MDHTLSGGFSCYFCGSYQLQQLSLLRTSKRFGNAPVTSTSVRRVLPDNGVFKQDQEIQWTSRATLFTFQHMNNLDFFDGMATGLRSSGLKLGCPVECLPLPLVARHMERFL